MIKIKKLSLFLPILVFPATIVSCAAGEDKKNDKDSKKETENQRLAKIIIELDGYKKSMYDDYISGIATSEIYQNIKKIESMFAVEKDDKSGDSILAKYNNVVAKINELVEANDTLKNNKFFQQHFIHLNKGNVVEKYGKFSGLKLIISDYKAQNINAKSKFSKETKLLIVSKNSYEKGANAETNLLTAEAKSDFETVKTYFVNPNESFESLECEGHQKHKHGKDDHDHDHKHDEKGRDHDSNKSDNHDEHMHSHAKMNVMFSMIKEIHEFVEKFDSKDFQYDLLEFKKTSIYESIKPQLDAFKTILDTKSPGIETSIIFLHTKIQNARVLYYKFEKKLLELAKGVNLEVQFKMFMNTEKK